MEKGQSSIANSHIGFLDMLRGIAILAVFLFHSFNASFGFDTLPWNGLLRDFHINRASLPFFPATYGWAGVAIFFALSGFCIHLSHARSRETGYGKFFVRRFFRIYPPYFLALLVFFLYAPWPEISGPRTWWNFATHAFLVQNFSQTNFFTINPAFWSVAVEAQLYLLYPLLCFATRKVGWEKSLLALLLLELSFRFAATGYTVWSGQNNPVWSVPGPPFAYWFSWAIGAYAAENYVTGSQCPLAKMSVWPWIIGGIGCYLFRPTFLLSFTAFSVGTTVAISRQVNVKGLPERASFIVRGLSFIGLVSYSFYLIHQPLLLGLHLQAAHIGLLAPHGPLVDYGICLLACPAIVFVSWLVYRLVEIRSIELGKKSWTLVQSLSKLFSPAERSSLLPGEGRLRQQPDDVILNEMQP
ncbi:MAG: acyltransferase [Verrucomicrobia bacterium]|nr:acyltransferase [Verrucomicrobiota bacterium]